MQQQQQQQQQSNIQLVESNGPSSQQQQQQDVTVRNFSPRMDYNNNEWRPVGRGDPLKNDPTFDYSPPTLDRVRYWADPDKDKENQQEDVATNVIDAKLKKANPGKNEILLLGVTGDRIRGGAPIQPQQHHPSHVHGGQGHIVKNAKGETPLLQPKYTSVRRSYYAHQLPTHLMPPPMQPMMPQQQQQQSIQPQTPQSHSQSHMSMGHMMKPQVHGEYRHQMNMPASSGGSHHSYVNSPAMSGSMNMHAKPYHMLSSTSSSSSASSSQPWMHAASPPASSMITSMPSHHMAKQPMAHGASHYSAPSHGQVHDAHHQESVNYLTYTRPSMQHNTPMAINVGSHEYYSPNSIRGSASIHKHSASSSSSSRKPWIHDLLKKEVIKTVKPSVAPNSYHSEVSIKPSHAYHLESSMRPHQMEHHFEPMLSANTPVSSTYTPVSFVTTTTTTTTRKPVATSTTPMPTQGAIYITSSTSTTPAYANSPTFPPIYTHTTVSTTQAPTRTTTTLSPTRLLIPNTSNLAYRPTVAPIKMTTDSLFSHYNQPEKPLRGPMYLIIEGHSKVKTYGKDELDPHKPKIVPVISSREPVVRRADPNEKRGTPETFQVKHLHSKTTQAMEKITTTTAKPATTKTTTGSTTKKPSVTTSKPSVKASTEKSKPATTKKPVEPSATKKQVAPNSKAAQSSTTTTAKPVTTTKATKKTAPKLSVTTSKTTPSTNSTTTTTTTTPKPKPQPTKEAKIPASKTPVKEEKLSPNNLNVLDTMKKPSLSLTGPTAMQGLLSFLDSSLDSLLKEEKPTAEQTKPITPTGTTKLKSISMNSEEPKIEARVSTKLQAIKAEDYEDYDEADLKAMKTTTEYLPRETRQIFDYDQLPESRLTGQKDNSAVYDDEDDLSSLGFDDEYEYEEVEEESAAGSQLIKRIDALVDDDFSQAHLEALNLARQQKATKA
ncbi:mucin-2 [Musca vetustissima]|uniref:mucin-2 n=1 Tax=Musca vetustissima TaxID=27455 RepID=UPI002AB6032B|nr:mucin-2 [Musca vetustissima]